MTFDDDHIRLVFPQGDRNIPCKVLGIEWPPPQFIVIGAQMFNRERCSQITDEQRANMTHVVRGAEYKPVPMDEQEQQDALIATLPEKKH